MPREYEVWDTERLLHKKASCRQTGFLRSFTVNTMPILVYLTRFLYHFFTQKNRICLCGGTEMYILCSEI